MLFISAAIVLTALTAIGLAWPLVKGRAKALPREAFNIAVYKDQLAELDRDIARGLISEAEAEAARAEIGRRLLAEDRQTARGAGGSRDLRLITALLIILVVPLGAGGLYLTLGNPGFEDSPRAARQAAPAVNPEAAAARAEMARLVEELKARLDEAPDEIEGWVLLARSQMSLARPQEAIAAYERVLRLTGGEDAQLQGEYAEARVIAAQGRVDEVAQRTFRAIAERDPTDLRARYYIALSRAQIGDTEGAVADWRALLAMSPADAPWVASLQQEIARLDPGGPIPEAGLPPQAAPRGPSQAQIEAAAEMSSEERQAMVTGMVEGLAARLETNPDDLEGWLRLGRSYFMLGRTDDARTAYKRALDLDPDNPVARNALMGLGD